MTDQQPLTIEQLATTSAAVAATRSRLKKIELLNECLSQAAPSELPMAVKFLAGELPQGKIGLGYAAVRKALDAAEQQMNDESSAPSLSLAEVDDVFTEIAAVSGKGSTTRRHDLLLQLLLKTNADGRAFLGRLILGELRHGALEGIMADAVASATDIPATEVRRAVMLAGDLSEVARVATYEGPAGLQKFSLQLFRPVQPMLAEPADDVTAALTRLDRASLEYKLDGVRVQVHKDGDEVKVFTRHLKEVTACLPELIEPIRQLQLKQTILDGEVLALRTDGRPHPFQITMRRFGRTKDIDAIRRELPLSLLLFDCLLVDGQSLLDEPTTGRWAALDDYVPAEWLIPRIVTANEDEAASFLASAMAAGHEGVMAKSLEAAYTAGGRGQSWLKIKPAHTLDLVVLAAEWGSGRRRGWLSNLHLGARDPATGQFVMVGKTFKGLTDKLLAWQTEQLLLLETARDEMTVFVEPQLVVEISFNEVQRSPHYPVGMALRFARVKRYRDDKSAAAADTIDTLAKLLAHSS